MTLSFSRRRTVIPCKFITPDADTSFVISRSLARNLSYFSFAHLGQLTQTIPLLLADLASVYCSFELLFDLLVGPLCLPDGGETVSHIPFSVVHGYRSAEKIAAELAAPMIYIVWFVRGLCSK